MHGEKNRQRDELRRKKEEAELQKIAQERQELLQKRQRKWESPTLDPKGAVDRLYEDQFSRNEKLALRQQLQEDEELRQCTGNPQLSPRRPQSPRRDGFANVGDRLFSDAHVRLQKKAVIESEKSREAKEAAETTAARSRPRGASPSTQGGGGNSPGERLYDQGKMEQQRKAEQNEQQRKAEQSLQVGDRVTVKADFMTNGSGKTALTAGQHGVVSGIDNSGDAMIDFDSIGRKCVLQKNFCKMEKEGGAVQHDKKKRINKDWYDRQSADHKQKFQDWEEKKKSADQEKAEEIEAWLARRACPTPLCAA
jgi:hypothetical protein